MTAKKKDADTGGGKKPGFEDSMERLEKIVAEMEGGSLSLERMIERFEEGQVLIKACTATLNEVERKIEILVKKGDEVTAEPFGEEDGEEADEPDEDKLF